MVCRGKDTDFMSVASPKGQVAHGIVKPSWSSTRNATGGGVDAAVSEVLTTNEDNTGAAAS